jgi:hypothetical protein
MSNLGKKDGKLLVRYSPLRLQVGCACCPPPPPPPPPPPDVCGCVSVDEIESVAIPASFVRYTCSLDEPGLIAGMTQEQTDWIASQVSANIECSYVGLQGVIGIGLCAVYASEDLTDGAKTEVSILFPCSIPGNAFVPPTVFVYYRRSFPETPPGEGVEVDGKYFIYAEVDFPVPGTSDDYDGYPTIRSFCETTWSGTWSKTGEYGVAVELTNPPTAFNVTVSIETT